MTVREKVCSWLHLSRRTFIYGAGLSLLALTPWAGLRAQDPFHLETSTGAEKLRLAAANFKPGVRRRWYR